MVAALAHKRGASVAGGELKRMANDSPLERDRVISKIKNSTTAQLSAKNRRGRGSGRKRFPDIASVDALNDPGVGIAYVA